MLPVETPFKTYTGTDGKPLDNGYVYFGQPNQNPITNPVTVYWDAAGTLPAFQPLRTVNGYVVRAGTPANVFFNGSYSELVQDSKGRQVFYARTSDDFSIATVVSNFISSLVASTGSLLIGFIQAGVGAIVRTIQDKLRESVSVEDFGAVDGSLGDAGPAFIKAFATGKAVRAPGRYVIASTVTVDRDDTVLIGGNPGYSQITSTVPAGYVMVLGTTAVPAKGGLIVRGLKFTRSSGTTKCLKITENLDALIECNTFSGFSDYAIEANQSDGLVVRKNLVFVGSIKAYSEMDRLVITENDVQAAPNHPAVEVYGGSGVVIEKNFLNWGNHSAIVLGYDSVRGDYPQAPVIRNNYIERGCQSNTGPDRPFIHIGAPIDQTGAAYAGAEVARWVQIGNNYFNADVTNANLANVIPALLERVIEVEWTGNRVINFTRGGAGANNPRIKYPARDIHLNSANISYIDLSTGGQGAFQQATFPSKSQYRAVEIYLGEILVPTDVTGFGSYNFTNIETGVRGLDVARLVVHATPASDCRAFVNNKSISAASGSDGSDRATWRVNVAGGPISTNAPVMVRAIVIFP